MYVDGVGNRPQATQPNHNYPQNTLRSDDIYLLRQDLDDICIGPPWFWRESARKFSQPGGELFCVLYTEYTYIYTGTYDIYYQGCPRHKSSDTVDHGTVTRDHGIAHEHASAVSENHGSRGTVIRNHGIFTVRFRSKPKRRQSRYGNEKSRHLHDTLPR